MLAQRTDRLHLVIGASGALGGALVELLARQGCRVRAFVRNPDALDRRLPGLEVEAVVGDALCAADVRRALAGAQVVFHCVSMPLTDYGRTAEAARVLAEELRRHPAYLVFPGNTWVFGRQAAFPITPWTPLQPPPGVAQTKARADALLTRAGVPATVVHLPDFYGPGVDNPLVRPLFAAGLTGKPVVFPGPVDVPHQFIYIHDAARALVAAARPACIGRRYTAGGDLLTVRELVGQIHRAAGTTGAVRSMPPWLLRLAGLVSAEARAAAGMMHVFEVDSRMDGAVLEADTGYRPQVSLQEGIARTLESLRVRAALPGRTAARA